MTFEHESANDVGSYLDLADFIKRAADDLRQNPDQWENETLEDFLRAWSAWLEDSPGYYKNRGEEFPAQPSWSEVAGMVIAAKIYE